MTPRLWVPGIVLFLAVCANQSSACSLCGANAAASPTFRQEAALSMARVILHGTIANPRLAADGIKGQTDFHIKTILRSDPVVKGKSVLVLPRYLPLDKGETAHYLLFCDVVAGKIDPYRGVRIKGAATVEYVKKALALAGKDSATRLAFFFDHLDDADPEVARDAFLEFAKASDADIAQAAPRIPAATGTDSRLRKWIKDPRTPADRLGIYAMLLGASGKAEDATYLRNLLDSKEDRYQAAANGLLAGYIQANPKEGWTLTHTILADGRKALQLRLAAMQALRFYHGAKPKESRPFILKVMKTVLVQGELADVAVEDLRRWQVWDLTPEVLKVYGQKGYDAPLMKRAILRYALGCQTRKDAGDFVKSRRTAEPDLVQEVEEALQFEKGM